MRVHFLGALALADAAVTYDEDRAIQYANFAGAAYCKVKDLQLWDCGSKCDSAKVGPVTVCEGDTTNAFITEWEGKGLVSFEGTSNVESLITDLETGHSATGWPQCGNCRVHSGFLKEYNSNKVCIMQALTDMGFGPNQRGDSSVIRSTGHSLGAALNNIFMIDASSSGWYIEESYDFGKPRTGDSDFAATHDNLLGDRTFRVTHDRDPVPQLPPADLIVDWHFQHVEPEIWYPSKVKKGYQECFSAVDGDGNPSKLCIEQFWNLARDALNLNDHLDYMGVDTSVFGCPVFEEEIAV